MNDKDKEDIWILERHGSGYRVRKGSRSEVATVEKASIAVLLAGVVAAVVWHYMWS